MAITLVFSIFIDFITRNSYNKYNIGGVLMKYIRVSTDLEVSIHDFPTGNYFEQNMKLKEQIGDLCDLYEVVRPKRLYKELGHKCNITENTGESVCMLIDEEGLIKKGMSPNLVASFLYEADKHGTPIMGNVLFVGLKNSEDGMDLCGIQDDVCGKLKNQLLNIINSINNIKKRKE